MPTPAYPIVTGTYAAAITATVTLPTTAATTESSAINITVEGAKIGQMPIVILRSGLTAGVLITQPAYVSAADTVTFKFYNTTGSQVYGTPGSAVVDVILL